MLPQPPSPRSKFLALLAHVLMQTDEYWLQKYEKDWRDQERVPAGSPEGGQFGSGGGGLSPTAGIGRPGAEGGITPGLLGGSRLPVFTRPSTLTKPKEPRPLVERKPLDQTHSQIKTAQTTKTEEKAQQRVNEGAARAIAEGRTGLTGSDGHPDQIQSAWINAAPKNVSEVDRKSFAQPIGKQAEKDPENFAKDMERFKHAETYLNFRKEELDGKSPTEIRDFVKDHMKENLRFLARDEVQKAAETNPAETKQWYPGARNMVDDKREALPEKVTVGGGKVVEYKDSSLAGSMAALSPQKDWYENVYLWNAVVDIHSKQQDTQWTPEMQKKSDEIWQSKPNPKTGKINEKRDAQLKAWAEQAKGKKLNEITDANVKAVWIRTYDETYSNRNYHIINPDGSKGPLRTNQPTTAAERAAGVGKPSQAAWGGVPQIANSIKALESNGDRNALNEAMGDRHKVRSFYNNILDPFSKNGDGTMDTHANGAALLRPLSNKHAAVLQSMASGSAPGEPGATTSKITGIRGLYHVYNDATREVATELNLPPRALQSITWETKRKLFDISDVRQNAIERLWKAYQRNPNITLDQVQQRILKISTEGIARRKEGRKDEDWDEGWMNGFA